MSRITRITIVAVAVAAIVAPVAGAKPDFYAGANATPSPQTQVYVHSAGRNGATYMKELGTESTVAAPAEPPSASFSWTVAGIGAGALAVLLALVVFVTTRRRPARRLAL